MIWTDVKEEEWYKEFALVKEELCEFDSGNINEYNTLKLCILSL